MYMASSFPCKSAGAAVPYKGEGTCCCWCCCCWCCCWCCCCWVMGKGTEPSRRCANRRSDCELREGCGRPIAGDGGEGGVSGRLSPLLGSPLPNMVGTAGAGVAVSGICTSVCSCRARHCSKQNTT